MTRRAVLVVCDGHRSDFVDPDLTPAIHAVGSRGTRFEDHCGVFPTVTRVAASTITTGCRPGRHGLVGNLVALPNGEGRLVVRDSSQPDFRDHMRTATGRTLAEPALPQYLAEAGGAIVCSNGSAGSARFQDPGNHGFLYHRDGSFGPGAKTLSAPFSGIVAKGAPGDRVVAEYFCREVLPRGDAALSVLWLSEPDIAMHGSVLGSEEHFAAVARADSIVAMVAEVVERLRDRGDGVLLMVGSDHGQETVAAAVDVVRPLVAAGLKDSRDSDDILVVPQGSAALVYASEPGRARVPEVLAFLEEQDWTAEIFHGDGLDGAGLNRKGGLVAAFAMARLPGRNEAGVDGLTLMAEAEPGKAAPYLGKGMHGGLGDFESRPFLIASGGAFEEGRTMNEETSILDIAPTILDHLGLSADGLDGRPLQDVLSARARPAIPLPTRAAEHFQER